MKKLIIFFLISNIFNASVFVSTELGPHRLLRKISRRLRGIDPRPEEYAALDAELADSPANLPEFIKGITAAYLESSEYQEKLVYWLDGIFGFKARSVPLAFTEGVKNFKGNQYSSTPLSSESDAATDLFRSMGKNNLSWDTLLVGKKYSINDRHDTFYGNNGGSITSSDADFFSGVPEVTEGRVTPGDPRVAGVLTTERFWLRFGASYMNENRRQAAAVFRIFLCDPMKPAFVIKKEDDKKLMDEVFAIQSSDNNQAKVELASHDSTLAEIRKRHGQEVSCMACHYKLDPLGQSFVATEGVLSAKPMPGTLTFRSATGKLIKVDGSGIGALAKAITKTSEYQSCQVQTFWKKFIDDETPMTPTQIKEAVAAFNSPEINRKTNSFISYLISRPEFLQTDWQPRAPGAPQGTNAFPGPTQAVDTSVVANFTPNELSKSHMTSQDVGRARGLLNRCNTCHRSTGTNTPDLAQWPIQGDMMASKVWVAKMQSRLNKQSNAEGAMPMDRDNWKREEISLVQRYVNMLNGEMK